MKKRFMFLCLAVLLFAGAVHAQDSGEKEVRIATEDNIAAIIHKDAAALNRQYTDDYYRISATGKVAGKSQTIAGFLNPDFEVTKINESDVKIRVYGNVAVVTELITATAGPKGKTPTELASWHTVVWLRQHGVWQKNVLQETSTTPIPASHYTR